MSLSPRETAITAFYTMKNAKKEVKANRSVYNQEAQEKLYRILTQLTEKTGE